MEQKPNKQQAACAFAEATGYASVWYIEMDDRLCESSSVMPQAYASLDAAERRAERLNRRAEEWETYRVRSLAVVGRHNAKLSGRAQEGAPNV